MANHVVSKDNSSYIRNLAADTVNASFRHWYLTPRQLYFK